MFAYERMSKNIFAVNMLPTMEFEKGGGGGPPPPDYAGQWDTAQKAFYSGTDTVRWAQTQYSKFTADGNANREIIITVNNRANSEIAGLDGIINQTSGIPDYIFVGSQVSKGEALSILQGVRNNLASCISVVPPIVTPPPAPTPPPTSPKVETTPQVLAPIAPVGSGLVTSGGGLSGFLAPVGGALSALSNIGAGSNPPPISVPVAPTTPIGCIPAPVFRCPSVEDISSSNPLQKKKGDWFPTGKIEGYGYYTPDMGVGAINPGLPGVKKVYDEDGNVYGSVREVPLGKAWSYSEWKWKPKKLWDDPNPERPTGATPSEIELSILKLELAKQLKQLQAINRVLNKPIDPAPPQNIYPTTSWQYEFWNKGYSLFEIHYAEEEAARRRLLDTTEGNFSLFKTKVEDILQDAILSGAVRQPVVCELYPPVATGTGTNGQPILIAEPVVTPMPYQPDVPKDPGLGQPTVCPAPPPPCQLPVDYFDDNGNRIDPKKIPNYLRRRRIFQSQGIRNRPIDLKDIPSVATCAPNTVPRPGNWEDCLIGQGATVSQLDSIRRAMAMMKLAPNADICAVTGALLNKLQTSNVKDPLGNHGKPNMLTSIPGVLQSGISSVAIGQSNAVAQVRTQQARRGALINRNRRPTMS